MTGNVPVAAGLLKPGAFLGQAKACTYYALAMQMCLLAIMQGQRHKVSRYTPVEVIETAPSQCLVVRHVHCMALRMSADSAEPCTACPHIQGTYHGCSLCSPIQGSGIL